MENAEQEPERGTESVRDPLRREGADGRPRRKLTYTECLEPPVADDVGHDLSGSATQRDPDPALVGAF
jgi:hypothetical protein